LERVRLSGKRDLFRPVGARSEGAAPNSLFNQNIGGKCVPLKINQPHIPLPD
jgi:hypothetical protein